MNADKKYKYEAYKLELYTLCDVLYREHLKTVEMAQPTLYSHIKCDVFMT